MFQNIKNYLKNKKAFRKKRNKYKGIFSNTSVLINFILYLQKKKKKLRN